MTVLPPPVTPITRTAAEVAALDAAPSATRRLLGQLGEGLLGGLAAGLILVILAPVVIGWRPFTVLTGSMRPVIQPGDVVMDRPVPISQVHVGDVITFSDPGRQGALVTHRVRSLTRGPVMTEVETRGDANNASERWSIKTSDPVGRVVYVIPKVGYVANTIRTPLGILFLVVLPVLGIGFGVLRRIWREDDDAGAGAAAGAPGDAPAEQGADAAPDR